MAPKKKIVDKVPAGTGDAADSGSTPNVIGGNDLTMDPGKDPSQAASAASKTNTSRPMTWSTRGTDQPAQPASERGISEDPTQTPNPHRGSGDLLLPKTYSEYSEPSERSASADPDPEELGLGNQIQEMLDTINEHMDEVKSIHKMSRQVAQLLVKTNESNSALEARTRTLRTRLIAIRERYPTIAKGKSSIPPRDPIKDPNNEDIDPHSERPINWSDNYVDEESTNGQPNADPELIQSTDGSNNRSNPKQALGKARTELLAKTAMLERLTRMEYERLLRLSKAGLLNPQDRQQSIQPSENAREISIWDKPRKSVQYAPFDGIKDNDTDSETTVSNHWEGSVPFQQLDNKDILDMSNNESDNALVRMVRYMLDQNLHMTMEKSPLAKAGVKVTPPDKYSGEQSFEALETFVKGLLRWLDMHSMLGPDAYKYQVLFLGIRLEGKALRWFDKTVEPRKYQGTPMDLEQVVTGLYGQYIPSLARCEASNKFDFIKQGTLSMQEFATKLELYFVDNLRPGLQSLLLQAGYDPEKKTIHKLYRKAVKIEDSNRYDIGVRSSEPMTSNSRRDDNTSSNTRRRPRNNGPDRTKCRADPPKSGEINKGPSMNIGLAGVNRNSSNASGGAGPPIINRQQMNHDSSHNSIECYNCGAVHIEDSPTEQVDNADHDINDPIDDERSTEDEYRNEDYDNQLDLSEDQHSWGSKPSKFNWSDDNQPCQVNSVRYSHDMARVAAAVPIGPANARKAKIAKEGEPLYDYTVKIKTSRPTRSKNDLLMIVGYFLVGATGIRMHKLLEPIGIQQAFQGSRAKLYYTATMDITVGQQMYTETFDIANANIDFNGLGSIVINGEMIDNDLSIWLASSEAKIHGMSANKVTIQGEQPLEQIVSPLSKNVKESAFESIKNKLLVVPVPYTLKELQKLISLVAYMLPYCGRLKRPLDMLQRIYRDKPYICNEDVYNVILDINSALSTMNVVNYYDDIIIHDGYPNHHEDNAYSTKATVSVSDYKRSLNEQTRVGVSIEEVNDEDDLHDIVKNNDIKEDHHILANMPIKATRTYQGSE
ncbi:hypothetical protein M422DRAFT_270274 [Sphaerobolus stellatus SS14]|uniref:Uncharacterized protein n=1 Tax=Sphaerobolus stellatus (strain SS14) TaxID=990650 RepID=A0A0C9UTE0_SPHS4|nr:hypothetical protein M422DRAFT_270274 [Sphaerobolus stellatus SS14]